jgi:hypothetical protein
MCVNVGLGQHVCVRTVRPSRSHASRSVHLAAQAAMDARRAALEASRDMRDKMQARYCTHDQPELLLACTSAPWGQRNRHAHGCAIVTVTAHMTSASSCSGARWRLGGNLFVHMYVRTHVRRLMVLPYVVTPAMLVSPSSSVIVARAGRMGTYVRTITLRCKAQLIQVVACTYVRSLLSSAELQIKTFSRTLHNMAELAYETCPQT